MAPLAHASHVPASTGGPEASCPTLASRAPLPLEVLAAPLKPLDEPPVELQAEALAPPVELELAPPLPPTALDVPVEPVALPGVGPPLAGAEPPPHAPTVHVRSAE